MRSIEVSVDDETYDEIDERAEEDGISSSDAVNNLIHKGLAYEKLEEEVEEMTKRQRRKNEVSEKLREEVTADLPTKLKWALFGKNND
jgi:metal-responsive CopG/Arc/MetJ family transcriptional regulator